MSGSQDASVSTRLDFEWESDADTTDPVRALVVADFEQAEAEILGGSTLGWVLSADALAVGLLARPAVGPVSGLGVPRQFVAWGAGAAHA